MPNSIVHVPLVSHLGPVRIERRVARLVDLGAGRRDRTARGSDVFPGGIVAPWQMSSLSAMSVWKYHCEYCLPLEVGNDSTKLDGYRLVGLAPVGHSVR